MAGMRLPWSAGVDSDGGRAGAARSGRPGENSPGLRRSAKGGGSGTDGGPSGVPIGRRRSDVVVLGLRQLPLLQPRLQQLSKALI